MLVFKLYATGACEPTGVTSSCRSYVLQRQQLKRDELEDVTAISYAWGSLPHSVATTWLPDTSAGETLRLQLGKEWSATGFLDELVALSAHSWLWLDQLSLRQCNATTEELNTTIPDVFKRSLVLVLLPGTPCLERGRVIDAAVSCGRNDPRMVQVSSLVIEHLMAHRRQCPCVGGIDVWLRRVWPWQEFAYADRMRLRFAAGGAVDAIPFDTMTLLRQQVLDKGRRGQCFIDLVRGDDVVFGEYVAPTRQDMLQYMSNYVEQNRVCTKDTDLISAVAPSIGATAVAGRSLVDGVKSLIEFMQAKTGSVYVGPLPRGFFVGDPGNLLSSYVAHERTLADLDSLSTVTKMALLHGTHFASGYSEDHDLLADIDSTIEVEDFLTRFESSKWFSELLRSMSWSQRRMMVRWLNSWKPSGGVFDEVFLFLKNNYSTADLTSERSSLVQTYHRVPLHSKQFLQLALILLRVIESDQSDLSDVLVGRSCLVKISKGSVTAMGYQCSSYPIGTVVAAGNCLMLGCLVDPSNDGSQKCCIFGRVPFVDRESMDFDAVSTTRILHQKMKPIEAPSNVNRLRQRINGLPEQNAEEFISNSHFPDSILKALRCIRENEVNILDISNEQGVDDEAVIELAEALEHNTALRTLYLYGNHIGGWGVVAIQTMLRFNTTLQHVHLPEDETDPCRNLLRLSAGNRVIWWSRAQEQAVGEILRAMHDVNSTITKVYLENDAVDDGTAIAIAEALKVNTTVTILMLKSKQIGDNGASALAEALMVNRTMREVYLTETRIGDKGASALAAALKANPKVKSLFLNANRIKDQGTGALAEALVDNQTVEVICLSDNEIGDVGAKALAEALKKNESVYDLYLTGNHIGDAGVGALAEALKENQMVSRLDLNQNQVGDDGASALAEVLKENQWMSSLYLTENHIGDDGARSLADALTRNRTLKELELSHNQIEDEGACALASTLTVNHAVHIKMNYNLVGEGLINDLKLVAAVTTLTLNNTRLNTN
ncbi:NLR, CARD domain-containing protein 3 [Phytophthora pseudosyringae]|uniref:NLR, CARD domain-containing protein 3 n=1 Tax=Phytophthora pseudosyringae TaxID=221518 RepID=A0A8T1VM68_9STRA|nr:NLR, CARD domain-containing protein 3 [Phytophthora pseudosyringae]